MSNILKSAQSTFTLEQLENRDVTEISFYRDVDSNKKDLVGIRVGVRDFNDPEDITRYFFGHLDIQTLYDLATYCTVQAERLEELTNKKFQDKIMKDIEGDSE